MRLARATLVHLDGVADISSFDLTNQKTTVIDLDGCGVLADNEWTRGPSNEWEH